LGQRRSRRPLSLARLKTVCKGLVSKSIKWKSVTIKFELSSKSIQILEI
jgi:hypothetical protein